ncbi:MAG: YtxH domain-containing protein [Candidatus Woesearchaeota archaeon]
MSSDANFTKGFIFGTIIGGAIGAITALLLAPKSGKELRQDIAEKSSEIYGKASDLFNQVESKVNTNVSSVINEGKEKAKKIISEAKVQADALLHNAEKVLNEAKMKASSAKEIVQEKIDTLRDAAKASVEAFKAELKSTEEE